LQKTTGMDHEHFVRETMERGGFGSAEQAERAIEATLATIGHRLDAGEAEAVARELPAAYAQVLRASRYERDFDVDELFRRVARREGIDVGFAREHAEVVCQIVGESLSDEGLALLRRHLPPPIAELFAPREAVEPPEPAPHRTIARAPAPRTTLAEGREGSRHPVSEARPERGHAHSVARSADPHGDTKLSSSRGTTQERMHETLAEGAPPGPKRPVSGG
jgi:uncharacterized protein (DUF2267 family)